VIIILKLSANYIYISYYSVNILLLADNFVKLRPHDPTNRHHEWIIVGDRIQNKYDNRVVLDIMRRNTMNGANLMEYKFNGGENQRWRFEYVSL